MIRLSNNIKSNAFRVGFEVECLIYNRYFDDLYKVRAGIKKAIDKKIVVGYDMSIHYYPEDISYNDKNYYPPYSAFGVEIRTPPLKTAESLNLLAKVFEFVKTYGYTNDTCGLHLNISPVSNRQYYRINPFYLQKCSLWPKMRAAFNRTHNDYCMDFPKRSIKKTPLQVWKQINDGQFGELNIWKADFDYYDDDKEHHNIINFDNCHSRRRSDSRIEIRAMGGKDYHLRLKDVVYYTDRAIQEIKKSFTYKKMS